MSDSLNQLQIIYFLAVSFVDNLFCLFILSVKSFLWISPDITRFVVRRISLWWPLWWRCLKYLLQNNENNIVSAIFYANFPRGFANGTRDTAYLWYWQTRWHRVTSWASYLQPQLHKTLDPLLLSSFDTHLLVRYRHCPGISYSLEVLGERWCD